MVRKALTRALLAVLSLAAAGCGTMNFPARAGGGGLEIAASSSATTTNGQIALRATGPLGEPPAVTWRIVSGTNVAALGQGSVDASGVYTAPGSISADSIAVTLEAKRTDNPADAAWTTITVKPGFVQPLLPQDVALTPGATAEVTAEIAEVNAGDVSWSLTTAPQGSSALPAGVLGTLSANTCQRTQDHFTTCTVTYSAPSALPAQPVYVVATVNGSGTTAPLRVLVDDRGIVSNPVTNQAIQPGLAALGSSGGNDGDYDTYQDANGDSYLADCCGGTLGALVQDQQGTQFILSNNHVLAESDQGHIGDTIDQPGLIDGACTPLNRPGSVVNPVATLKYIVPLASRQTNVDAALALAAPGAIDPSGAILGLGTPGASGELSAAPPMAGAGEKLTAANLGMDVAKSGRTTGLTCSNIDAVALAVKIDYFKDCAETQPYSTKTYTNQIGISGSHFTDSGDSGALVLDAANSQAIGLYFAGGTDGDGHGLSVANPIGDVLGELSAEAGSRMSLVGTATPHPIACLQYDPAVPSAPPAITPELRVQAQTVADQSMGMLRPRDALGTAAGASLDDPGQPAVTVYVANAAANIPQTIDGVRTQVIVADAAAVARGQAPTMPALEPGLHLTPSALAHAQSVVQQVASRLMTDPAIFGVGVTQSRDNPAEAALLVLVDIGRTPRSLPPAIDGLRVQVLRLHRFHTTRARDFAPERTTACSLKGLRPEKRAEIKAQRTH
jgi:hypothetical protein